LLVLLTGFAFSLYYFYQQKFLVEVQKDFIDNVTHEFSTPLSVIEISVEGLKKPSVSSQPEKYNKYVDSIKYQSDYLKSHISNLIRTVVAGNYHFAVNKKPVVPDELLKRAVLQLEPLLEKSNGRVEWSLEDHHVSIQADEENLYLAIFNIISNAIKYSVNPVISINASVKNNLLFISIKDNGVGIEYSDQKKIFKKFYRVPSGNLHAVKGLGLGLYFTHKVIQGHGGNIRVNSKPGTGTEFIIELPVKN
jgi:two-component system phosphate regulon sensor histidine kinase PhoR